MDKSNAIQLFEAKEVPAWLYVTDGDLGNGECCGIECTNGVWTTYYSERGSKQNIKVHKDEATAVQEWIRAVDSTLKAYEGRSLT